MNPRAERVGLRGSRYTRYSLAERLAARTTKGPDCWICSGAALPNGYVQLYLGRDAKGSAKFRVAHRVAWELANGPIPDGLVVMHTCDTPRCVRVDHLKLGSQAENIYDSIHKGRFNAFGKQKLNAAQVREIRALAARGMRQKDIAAKFGIKRHSVSGIVNFKSWQHVGPFDESGLANVEPVRCVQVPVRGVLHVGQLPTASTGVSTPIGWLEVR